MSAGSAISPMDVRRAAVPQSVLAYESGHYCRRCLSTQVHETRAHTIWERVLHLFRAQTVRCRQCFSRSTFWAR